MSGKLKIAFIWAVYMPVVLSTYFIVWLDRKIKFRLSFPRDLDELSKKETWCLAELKAKGVLPTDAVVISYKVNSLNQDMIFRSNAGVVEINYTAKGEQKTLRCFAKFAPISGSVWNKTIFNLQLNHIKEIAFNQYFADDASDFVPKVYVAKLGFITGNLCLITECMDDCIEYKDSIYENLTAAHLDMALKGMATLHAHYWRNKSERVQKILAIKDDTLLLFDSIVSSSWSKAARKILFESWHTMNEFQTVVHGDSRIGNMMFPKDENHGRFVLLDWQAVRKGKAVYDLAYFLILSLTMENRKHVEESAIVIYYDYLVANGVSNYTKEEMMNDYRHACLCILVLLSLPYLSGEASAEGNGVQVFAWGMNAWREKMQLKFFEFDYAWVAKNYSLTETEARDAVNEMLNVIDKRVKSLTN